MSDCASATYTAPSSSPPPATRPSLSRPRIARPGHVLALLHALLRNASDHLPRKVDGGCPQELRWLYDRRSIEEARQDLAGWVAKWGRYPKLVRWVEETIEEGLIFYRLLRQHHKHLKSTGMLGRGDDLRNVGILGCGFA